MTLSAWQLTKLMQYLKMQNYSKLNRAPHCPAPATQLQSSHSHTNTHQKLSFRAFPVLLNKFQLLSRWI